MTVRTLLKSCASSRIFHRRSFRVSGAEPLPGGEAVGRQGAVMAEGPKRWRLGWRFSSITETQRMRQRRRF